MGEIFGIPGGVVLDFLQAVDDSGKIDIEARLSMHEQSAVFSAIGYSRATNGLGVAYATRGPGITNTLTAVADAYYDSVPVLIITGHSSELPPEDMRVMYDQEIDIVKIFNTIVKSAVRVDTVEQFMGSIESLLDIALQGRPGPVLLDMKSSLWNLSLPTSTAKAIQSARFQNKNIVSNACETIESKLRTAKRPIFLLGDGFRGKEEAVAAISNFSEKFQIPILSGRFSEDLFKRTKYYFGYIGTHGLRSGMNILTKTDLIISIGNRMHYPVNSKSFAPVMEHINVIRCDIDEMEFNRKIPNTKNFKLDLRHLCLELKRLRGDYINPTNWIDVCQQIQEFLAIYDRDYPIPLLVKILDRLHTNSSIVCDVGNNEFWVAKAYYESKSNCKLYFSKSFGAMGSATGKAIGISHACSDDVICFAGDQGLLMNIQDLHYISNHSLPVKIFVLNNKSSGMIRSRQLNSSREILQTTEKTGYSMPDFCAVAAAFGIPTLRYEQGDDMKSIFDFTTVHKGPLLVEIISDPEVEGIPHLPAGAKPNEMAPTIPVELQHLIAEL